MTQDKITGEIMMSMVKVHYSETPFTLISSVIWKYKLTKKKCGF